jgi:superfamily I DNA/RNA helicase
MRRVARDSSVWARTSGDQLGQKSDSRSRGTAFTREEIEAVIARNVALRRQHGGGASHLFNAMTVQQAKNREFEGVVIIWPYQVGGDFEHKRRLLYNAVTRAKRWCNIIVQGQNILAAAPFA